jgi:response regulator RpfG family c-di-GMP phosphodiesterase
MKWIYGIHKLREDAKITSQLKIILLHANSLSESEKAELKELGVDRMVKKPIEYTQFKEIIGA